MNKKNLPIRGLRPLDAGGIFLLAEVTLYMLQSLIIIILGFFVQEGNLDINGNMPIAFTLMFMNQLSFAVIPLIYGRFQGIDYAREINFKRGISIAQIGMLVLISFATIVAFMPLSSLFIELFKVLGYGYEMALPNYYENVGVLILSIIFIAILPAFGEEILFRGFVARGLRKFGIIAAFLLSSLIFATAHGNLLQLVYQFLLGLVLITVYFATRSIYASMVVHVTNNTTALIINYVLFHTTGSTDFSLPLEGASLVFAMLGISLLGMVILTLLMWAFLRIAKKRQDAYVAGREVDITKSAVYGRHNKKGTNFITKYLDFIKYLNYSFEENEAENSYKIKEQIDYENAVGDEDKRYAGDLLKARLEKNRRWDRNMVGLALVFNAFILIVNIINAFK